MSNQLAIEILTRNRDELIRRKQEAIDRYDMEISILEGTIDELSGKKVWVNEPPTIYDDESPDYIKNSFEE